MNDRELLELAAKAAGVGGGWGDRFEYHNGAVDLSDIWIVDQEEFCPWNPLIDDGDCARMEAELMLSVVFNDGWVSVGHTLFGPEEYCEFYSAHRDRNAARRKASTYAAAEIGKSL